MKKKAAPAKDDAVLVSTHTVIKITVDRAAKKCPSYRPGDYFLVRQHMLDTTVSSIRNFCFHALYDLYDVYARVRKGPVGNSKVFHCRDKKMVKFIVERLPDEHAAIGRAETGV